MKNKININKIAGATHAILFVISAIWFASLAIRGYCSWGFNGFAGYTLISYVFFAVTNGFLQNALSVKADTNFKENIE